METDYQANPGMVLRKRREERGLSIEDVAKSLNLTARSITALEENDYKKLPGTTYTRGYIRNYAGLLDLAPEPLVDAFMLRIKDETQEIKETMPAADARQGNSRTVITGGLIVGAVIIGLSIIWWQGQNQDNGRIVAGETTTIASDADNTDGPTTVEDNLASTNEFQDQEAAQAPGGQTETSKGMADNHKVTAIETNKQAADSGQPKAGTSKESAGPYNKVASSTGSSTGKKPRKRIRIVLHANQPSWADIRDAKNNKLLYETVVAGRVVTLEGIAPFSVFLGNPDGVDIVMNGKQYNIKQHKQGMIARFKLGAQPE